MGLRTGIFSSWIARRSFNRSEPALTGQTTLQLGPYLVSCALFHRVSAPRREQEQSKR